MAKATVETNSGAVVSGEIVRDENPVSWGDVVIGVLTCGMSTILGPPDVVTVKDDDGNYFTGTKK